MDAAQDTSATAEGNPAPAVPPAGHCGDGAHACSDWTEALASAAPMAVTPAPLTTELRHREATVGVLLR